MGVIKQKGIIQSAVTYIGVLVGVANTMYFYPKFFTEEQLGLFRFLMETATMVFPFITLGIHNLSVRMFPTFRNEKNGHNGLLFLLLIGILIGYLLFLLIYFITEPWISELLIDESPLIQQYWPYIIPMSGFVIISMICTQYILNFKKVLFPSIVNDLFTKIGLPIIAMGCFFGYLSLTEGVFVLVAIYALSALVLFVYIFLIKEAHFKPSWKFLKRPLLKEMGTYSLYGVLGSLGGVLATRIDIFMLSLLAASDVAAAGVYSIAMLIANVITVPARAITNISSPVIAESFEQNDLKNVERVYIKSSIVLLTLGLLFLIGIWASIDDIFTLMPNGDTYAPGKYVILILGIGKLVDLATGTNHQVIGYSSYFRFNFYAVLILAVINVISNYIFIPIYQINGAALATACSLIVFNISKTVFVYYKMNFLPFSLNTIKVLIIGLISYGLGVALPSTKIIFLDIVFRSLVIAGSFVSAILYLNISEDLTKLFWQIIDKVKSRGR